MKLVVGLGNPGEKYASTRHNVGFMAVEQLAKQFSISSFQFLKKHQAEIAKVDDAIFAMPQTYMNESGRAVRSIMDYFRIDSKDVFIAHDDLDIEMGKYKIELGHGPKIHNGVNSVEQVLKTKDFWRIRIGVDNRSADQRAHISGRDYVLMKLNKAEIILLEQTLEQVVEELFLRFGFKD